MSETAEAHIAAFIEGKTRSLDSSVTQEIFYAVARTRKDRPFVATRAAIANVFDAYARGERPWSEMVGWGEVLLRGHYPGTIAKFPWRDDGRGGQQRDNFRPPPGMTPLPVTLGEGARFDQDLHANLQSIEECADDDDELSIPGARVMVTQMRAIDY